MAMTPTVFEILLSLADGERHGYDIMLDVERRSAGAVVIRPGSLYRAVHRLLEQGLLEELEERPDPGRDDERRRYYRISEAGRAALRDEAERMESALRAVRDKKLMRAR